MRQMVSRNSCLKTSILEFYLKMNNNNSQFGFSRSQQAAAAADKGGSLKQTLARLEVSFTRE